MARASSTSWQLLPTPPLAPASSHLKGSTVASAHCLASIACWDAFEQVCSSFTASSSSRTKCSLHTCLPLHTNGCIQESIPGGSAAHDTPASASLRMFSCFLSGLHVHPGARTPELGQERGHPVLYADRHLTPQGMLWHRAHTALQRTHIPRALLPLPCLRSAGVVAGG